MKNEGRPSAHSPGAQGHDAELRRQIAKLQSEHAEMMGSQAKEDFTESVQGEDVTSRLYDEQAPDDYGRRKLRGMSKGRNSDNGNPRRGDVGGGSGY